MKKKPQHWLLRNQTLHLLSVVYTTLLAITLFAGLFVHQHEAFGIESSFGFYAWFGFFACVLMVVFAKVAGIFLKRPDDYYESAPPSPPTAEQERSPHLGNGSPPPRETENNDA